MGRNYFGENMQKVWGGMKRGWEPNGLFTRATEAAWSMRFEVLAAVMSEIAWWLVRALISWLLGSMPRRRSARVIRLRPTLHIV